MSALPLLGEVVERHLAHYANVKTRKHCTYTMRTLLAVLGSAAPLSAITPDDLDRWDAWQIERGYAASTLATRRKHVKAFFAWCVKRELLERNPARFIEIREPRPSLTNKAMPEQVLHDILAAARRHPYRLLAVRNTAVLMLMATYGARVGDVAQLTTERVVFDRQVLILKVKGGKDHELPLLPEVETALRLWVALRASLRPAPGHEVLFVSIQPRGDERYPPLTTGAIRVMVERLSKAVCGVVYRPHSIRHWRGQSLADVGTAPTVVQHVLGHQDVQTTLRFYYNQDMERVQRALETTPPPAPKEERRIIPFRRRIG